MSLEIRTAIPADAEELLITWEEARKLKCSRGDEGWGIDPFTMDDVAQAIEHGTTNIVQIGNRHAGAFEQIWSDNRIWGEQLGNDGQASYIHRLARRLDFTGQKFGPLVVEWASQTTFEAGRNYVRLDCDATNVKLCGYYESLGFISMGSRQIGRYAAALYQRSA